MRKLVILNIGEGSFEQGFPVTIQIGEEGVPPQVAETGRLPAAPDLPLTYQQWQSSYDRLGLRSRIKARQVTARSLQSDCQQAAQQFCAQFNQWLRTDCFRPIQDLWLQTLDPSDEIRVLLQTQDATLQRLPWHLWDVFTRYPHAEVGLSSPAFKTRSRPLQPKPQVTILAILGDSSGIDTTADRVLLEQLPGASVTFLVEPTRRQLANVLLAQPWDIFFFAGHSESPKDCGHIYLNSDDKLTIPDLKYTLSKAVAAGLQLAILNSCDGMNPARDLSDLQIPQIVFMREPVPDQVAQEFLKYFLAAFSQGDSLYLALRTARERLEALEDEFLYATWLPVIFQHPTAIPPTWHELRGVAAPVPAAVPPPIAQPRPQWKSRLAVVLTSAIATAGVLGVRHLGLLQPWELQAYDRLLQARSLIRPELPDNRIVVIEITDQDYAAQQERNEVLKDTSLSDTTLVKLLRKLNQYQPRVIGLDLFRDAKNIAPEVAQALQQTPNLIGICKSSSSQFDPNGKAPPAGIPADRVGFNDLPKDPDEVIRRTALKIYPEPNAVCPAAYAVSLQIALKYLQAQGIQPQWQPDGNLQLGSTLFRFLNPVRQGAYQNVNDLNVGYQLLLNYRAANVRPLALTDVLNDQQPLAIQDRIVIIGATRQQPTQDVYLTPYDRPHARGTDGVFIVSQQVSQIISAVLDQRSLIWMWSAGVEALWIAGWAVGSAGIIAWLRTPRARGAALLILVSSLWGLSLVLLTQGGWVPLVPPLLALLLSTGAVCVGRFDLR